MRDRTGHFAFLSFNQTYNFKFCELTKINRKKAVQSFFGKGGKETEMKKFVFTMQKMRDYKKQILESEKNKLMGLIREKNELEEKMEELEMIMDNLRRTSNEAVAKGTTASELMFYSMQMDGVKRDQVQTRYQINFAEMKIDNQRRRVVKQSQELSGLDKLEEQQREEYRRLEAKENEMIIEEFLSFKLSGA